MPPGKKYLLFLIIGLFGVIYCNRNEVSSENDRLTGLAKVWGFLKYYHPEVASGTFNWDSVLIESIPKVRDAESKESFNQILIEILETAGDIEACENCVLSKGDTLVSLVDFSWLNESIFSKEVIKKLKFIRNNKRSFENHYVLPSNLNDARFPGEHPYENLDNPDLNYRLLALFRYWNVIEYFYPYKNLSDLEWDLVLDKMIPVFIAAENGFEYYLAVRELHTHINDGHAYIYSAPYDSILIGQYHVPATLKKIDNRIIVSSFSRDSVKKFSALKRGDVITHLNSKPIRKRYRLLSKYLSSPNPAQHERVILGNLLSGNTREVNVKILRNDEPEIVTVHRISFSEVNQIPRNSVPVWDKIDNEIGYVNMGQIDSNDQVKEVFDNLLDTRVMILDIRNYPPFMTFFEFISYLFDGSYPQLIKMTQPYFNLPGYFIERGYENELHREVLLPLRENSYKGHLVLLVNEFTQSRAEFFTAILQNYSRVTTIGSQTAGTDGNITFLYLPGNIRVWFTGSGSHYADGTVKQRKGVNIDITVNPTLEGIKKGEDEVMATAIEYAKSLN